MKTKSFYSWSEFDSDCDALIELIKQSNFVPKSVVCVASGGLVLGAKLKNKMELPLAVFTASSYDDEERKGLNLQASFLVPVATPCLLVDDICDSGSTMAKVLAYLADKGVEVRTAVLHYKEKSGFKPDWFLNKVDEQVWTVYPWEK